MDVIAIGDATGLGIDGVHEHALRVCLFQPVDVVERRVRAMHVVVAHRLQRVLFRFRPEGAEPFLDVLGNGRRLKRVTDGRVVLGYHHRENFEFAGWRLERIGLRIGHVIRKWYFVYRFLGVRDGHAAAGDEGLLVAVDIRILGHHLIDPLVIPVFGGLAALGVFVIEAQALGQHGADLVVVRQVVERLDGLGHQDAARPECPVGAVTPGLEVGADGQDDVRELGRGRHELLMHHDELAQRFVFQNLDGAVDVAVLVDDRVATDVVEELDAVGQGFLALRQAAHAFLAAHFLAAQDDIGPGVDGEGVRHLIRRGTEAGCRGGFSGGGGIASARRKAAGDADVFGDCGRDGAKAVQLLAVRAAVGAPAGEEHARAIRIFAGQAGDGVCRHGRDFLGPLRSLRHAIALAQDIGLEGFFALVAFGHVLVVVPHGDAVDILFVDQPFGDQGVGHSRHHGAVGAGPDRDPFVGQANHRQAHARVNDDDLGPGLAGQLEHVGGVGAMDHLCGVPGPHDDHLAILPVRARLADAGGAVHGQRCRAGARRRIAVVVAERAAEHVQQATDRAGAGQHAVAAGSIVVEDRGVAVRFLDALKLAGDGVQRFFPANFLIQAGAALAGAAQRGLEPGGVVDTAAVGTPAHARDQAGIHRIVGPVGVGCEANDHAILNMGLEDAAAAAVVGAALGNDLDLALRLCRADRIDSVQQIHFAGKHSRCTSRGRPL